MTEYLRRAAAPRTVVALSRWRAPQQTLGRLRRLLGLRPRIELFFAYDDPYSALALPGLIVIAESHGAVLALRPLLERGIDGDPAAAQRRHHAVVDSQRLAQRDGRALSRGAPLTPEAVAFLAEWTAAAQDRPGIAAFAAAALHRLWFQSDGSVNRDDYAALYRRHLGEAPANVPAAPTVARNRARLLKLGHWESPAAYVGGEWFFAHERLPQIDACLRALES
ncbi:MAG: hypothetical protein E6R07_12655 [Nevskiaceae bacterium]|nr:MAG: hypothetical protein E6R07_12655 [Nevskiaceae bacterium]